MILFPAHLGHILVPSFVGFPSDIAGVRGLSTKIFVPYLGALGHVIGFTSGFNDASIVGIPSKNISIAWEFPCL
jgi:hypothetical protein